MVDIDLRAPKLQPHRPTVTSSQLREFRLSEFGIVGAVKVEWEGSQGMEWRKGGGARSAYR